MNWTDTYLIAESLNDAYPDANPLSLSFEKMHAMICALDGFADDPLKSNEAILEAILSAWLEEKE